MTAAILSILGVSILIHAATTFILCKFMREVIDLSLTDNRTRFNWHAGRKDASTTASTTYSPDDFSKAERVGWAEPSDSTWNRRARGDDKA